MDAPSRDLSLDDFICEMSREPVSSLTHERLMDLAGRLHLSGDLVGNRIAFASDAYARNLVCRTPFFELLVLCWRPGQESTIHDHARSPRTPSASTPASSPPARSAGPAAPRRAPAPSCRTTRSACRGRAHGRPRPRRHPPARQHLRVTIWSPSTSTPRRSWSSTCTPRRRRWSSGGGCATPSPTTSTDSGLSAATQGVTMTPLPLRPLGTSGLEITTVGFGSWAVGGGGWSFGWGAQDDERSVEAIAAPPGRDQLGRHRRGLRPGARRGGRRPGGAGVARRFPAARVHQVRPRLGR